MRIRIRRHRPQINLRPANHRIAAANLRRRRSVYVKHGDGMGYRIGQAVAADDGEWDVINPSSAVAVAGVEIRHPGE